MAKYYSRSKQKFIDIATMTDQHVRNAFIEKCKHEPAEDAIYAQQQEERASRLQDRVIELEKTIRKLNNQPTVTAEAYDVAWKKIETLERHKKDLRQSLDDALSDVNDLKAEVKTLHSSLDDVLCDLEHEENRAMLYAEMVNDKCPNGHAYVFSEIPNDDEGRELVQKMKDYLNKESYKIRVKGQYLDEETKRIEGWRVHQFGQPISKSKCLRVYVDVKKDDK